MLGLLGAAAEPPQSGWRTAEDYPAEALAAGRHGSAILSVDIDETGTIEACQVLRSTGTEQLDAASCRSMVRRVRYTISRDAQGRPKRVSASLTLHWVLAGMTQGPEDLPIGGEDVSITANPSLSPDERKQDATGEASTGGERLPFAPPKYPGKALKEGRQGRTSALITVDRRGRIRNCSIVRTSGSADLDQATCAFARDKVRYNPRLDPSGKAIAFSDILHCGSACKKDPVSGVIGV